MTEQTENELLAEVQPHDDLVSGRIAELERRREAALAMGGSERIARQHASGRLTARERITALVDAGSWFEIGLLALPEHRRTEPSPADAIVTGFGRISGRKVCVVAIDATVLAGTTAPVNMRKQNRVAEWAGRRGIPLVFLSDNDGGRIPDLLGWRFAGVPFDFTSFLEWAVESQPWEAAANIILDDVIDPRQTREVVSTSIDFAWGSGPRVTSKGR